MKHFALFILTAGSLLFLNACAWKCGDRTLYPLEKSADNDQYKSVAGVWEGQYDKNMKVSASFNFNSKNNIFQLDTTLHEVSQNNNKTFIIPTMDGNFTTINGEVFFCGRINYDAFEKFCEKSPDTVYWIMPLVVPVYYIVKLEIKDDTITVYSICFSKWDKEEKYQSIINSTMIYDPENRLLLNSKEQINDFITKNEYIPQQLIILQRKKINTPTP